MNDQPLQKILKGCWKPSVGDFKIVFKVVESEIRILGIRNRKEYLEITGRLSRETLQEGVGINN